MFLTMFLFVNNVVFLVFLSYFVLSKKSKETGSDTDLEGKAGLNLPWILL